MSDIEIQAPNGDVVRFPAGTPDATILSVMRREYGGSRGGSGNQTSLPGFTAMPYTTDAQGNNTVAEPPPNKGSTQEIPSTAGDAGRSFVSGARQGTLATLGLPGSAEWLARAGIDRASEFLGRGNPGLSNTTALPTSAQVVEEAAGQTPAAQDFRSMAVARNPNTAARFGISPNPSPQPFHQPETTAGRYAHTLGEFVPGALLPAGGARTVAQALARRGGVNVAAPALASEAAGQATEGTQAEPYARVAAALTAPYAPRAIMRLATPLPTTAARTAAANTLAGEGVELTAGQRTGSRALRFAESTTAETPFAGSNVPRILEGQGEQFSRAALRRVGEHADDVTATPEVLAASRARIGAEIERLATSNDIVFRNPRARNPNPTAQAFEQATLRAEAEYNAAVPNSVQRNPHVADLVEDLNNAIPHGGMAGHQYQAYRSRLTRLAQDNRADPQLSRFYAGIRDALDDAMEAGLSGADRVAWREARQQWRHLMVLEDAMAGAGEATALGMVTPAQLARASKSGNRQAYAEDRAPFSDISHAGAAIMGPMPNSGTPARQMMSGATLTGLVLAPAIGRTISSPGAQWYLGRQDLAGPLNWLGPTRPGSRVGRALMLPAETQGSRPDNTLSGR